MPKDTPSQWLQASPQSKIAFVTRNPGYNTLAVLRGEKLWARACKRTNATLGLLPLATSLALATCAFAYEHPLTSNSIREAYFLGQRNDEKVVDFLAQYIKRPPMPNRGPHISEISLYTPYAQVVLSSWRNRTEYSAQKAQGDFLSHPETVQVKVKIEFTATFNAMQGAKPDMNVEGEQDLILRPKDFWRDFQFEVAQAGKPLGRIDIHGSPIYGRGGFRGAEVWLEYEAKGVDSKNTVVTVTTPDNLRVAEEFDLAKLK